MEDDNFQTLNIKYKIKKIKNKKRNIQNIEPFETLSNVGPILDTNHNNNVAKNLDNPNLSYNFLDESNSFMFVSLPNTKPLPPSCHY